MLELFSVIKKQSDELHQLMNESYGTKVFTRVHATEQKSEAGDNVGEFPSTNNDRAGSISLHNLSHLDVTV